MDVYFWRRPVTRVQLKRSYPAQPFMGALEQALKYGMFDLTRLETLVLRHVACNFFALAGDDDDDGDDDDQDDTTHTPREALHAVMHELKFKGMDRVLDTELDHAERNGTPPGELIERPLTEQASFHRERALAYRVGQARLPWQWTIDTFPFERQSGVNKAKILGLAGLDFLRRTENLVLIGGPGTGKTAIALSLLRQACVNGWRGRFYSAQTLLDDRTTTRLLKSLSCSTTASPSASMGRHCARPTRLETRRAPHNGIAFQPKSHSTTQGAVIAPEILHLRP